MFRHITRSSRNFIRGARWSSTSQAPKNSSRLLPSLGLFAGGVVTTALYFNYRPQTYEYTTRTSSLPLDKLQAPKYASAKAQSEAFKRVEELVGPDRVTRSKGQLDTHSDTFWTTHHAKEHERPGMIVWPESTEEVSKIMKIAHEFQVPVVPFSGGTSLEGHFTPTFGGLCIDFGQMDKIVTYNKDDLDVVVQPAVGWEDLNEYLADDGLFFAPDPGPGAEIGGMIGTSCSGTNAGRYGTMKENVVNLTVVLADGTVMKTRQRPRKSSAGYNLTQLFVGSEGTLGLVTEATLKLTPRPACESVGVVTFETIHQAANTVAAVVQRGLTVGAVELLDDIALRSFNQTDATEKKYQEVPTLFFKFSGTNNNVDDQIKQVREVSGDNGSKSFEFAKDKEERDLLWSARKHALWSVIDASGDDRPLVWTTDVAVPISKLADAVSSSKNAMVAAGLPGGIVGHVLDGNYHCLIPYKQEEHQVVADLVDDMVKRALEVEGTATGEHGIGVGKKKYLEREVGVDSLNVMRQLKRALDPLCILNPDKVITMNPDVQDEH